MHSKENNHRRANDSKSDDFRVYDQNFDYKKLLKTKKTIFKENYKKVSFYKISLIRKKVETKKKVKILVAPSVNNFCN